MAVLDAPETREVTTGTDGRLTERGWLPAPLGRSSPVLVGLVAAGVSAAGASRPSLWFDEVATVSAATRPLPDLWRLLANIDVVHGLYYVLMHGWLTAVPATEFGLRAFSSLAVGAAAAGVVVLARRFGSRRMAVTAGMVFAILPRTTWAGCEARPYALSAAAAVWVTVLLVVAVRRNRPWAWLLYAAALPVATLVNAYLVTLLAVHALAVAVLARRRSAVLSWAVAAIVAAGVQTPFLLVARGQIAQVSWISPLDGHTVLDVTAHQYFDNSAPFAIIAAACIAAAAVVALIRQTAGDGDVRPLVVLAAAWMAIPTGTLLVYSAAGSPVYYPRYLTFTAPAMALLLGTAITRITRTPWQTAVVLVALAAAAIPNYVVVQRGPYSKEGMDFSQVADVVARHAVAGDCLLLDDTTSWRPGPIRPLLAARTGAYRKLVDLGRGTPATVRHSLGDGFVPVWTVEDRLGACTVLWTVSERDATLSAHQAGASLAPGPRLGGVPVYQIPHARGFHVVERWQFSFAQITRSLTG